jgi:hypothetical protein
LEPMLWLVRLGADVVAAQTRGVCLPHYKTSFMVCSKGQGTESPLIIFIFVLPSVSTASSWVDALDSTQWSRVSSSLFFQKWGSEQCSGARSRCVPRCALAGDFDFHRLRANVVACSVRLGADVFAAQTRDVLSAPLWKCFNDVSLLTKSECTLMREYLEKIYQYTLQKDN